MRNSTPYALEEVGLAIGLVYVKLGPLAPGQSVPVSFDPRLPPPTAPGNVAYSIGWQQYGVPAPHLRGDGMSTALELPQDPEIRRRVKVLETVLARADRRAYGNYGNGQPYISPTPQPPTLIATTTAAIGGDLVPTSGAQRTYQLTVLEQPVQLRVAAGLHVAGGASCRRRCRSGRVRR